MTPNVTIVDENDNVIGAVPREKAHADGCSIRCSAVIIRNAKNEILLARIADAKRYCPGRWTYSSAGHMDEGEIYEQTAVRELKEELGVECNAADLTFLTKFRVPEFDTGERRHFHSVYSLHHEGPFFPDASEIADLRWFTKEELTDGLQKNRDEFVYVSLDEVLPFL